jgi:DNA-binding NtrC family response regulator
MKKPPVSVTNPSSVVTVLSVSPLAEDYFSIQAVFDHSKWKLYNAESLASGLATMGRREIGVVICERDLAPGTWIDLLQVLQTLPNAPPLIVTSRLADERLWADALNLGAYDVLAKPFRREELVRSVSMAWLHWRHQHEASAKAPNVMKAAG